MIKLISIFTLFYFSTLSVSAQIGKYKWVNNETIHYYILYYSAREIEIDSFSSSRYNIWVDVPRRFENGKDTLNAKEIIKYLYDDETDWAANLLLYQIYKKDAWLIYSLVKSRDIWVECCKNEDIKYWEDLLKQ